MIVVTPPSAAPAFLQRSRRQRGIDRAVIYVGAVFAAVYSTTLGRGRRRISRRNTEPVPYQHASGVRNDSTAAAIGDQCAETVAKARDAGDLRAEYPAYWDLSRYYGLRGEYGAALRAANAAARAAGLAGDDHNLTTILYEIGLLHIRHKDFLAALHAANNAMALHPRGILVTHNRARVAIQRAFCYQQLGFAELARPDLDAAWRMLSDLPSPIRAIGCQIALAQWWTVTARQRLLTEDLEKVAEAHCKAVQHYRNAAAARPNPRLPYPAFAGALRDWGNTLDALGRPEEALSARTEARLHDERRPLP